MVLIFGYVIKGPGTSIRGQAFYDQDVASRLPVVAMSKARRNSQQKTGVIGPVPCKVAQNGAFERTRLYQRGIISN